MSDIEKRKLHELRVVDLKHELEKRGKDGNGVKNVLLERLTQALKDEKLNPETFEFEIFTGKTPAKKGKSSTGSSKDDETVADANGEEGGDTNMADLTVQDECNEEEASKAAKTDAKKVEELKANSGNAAPVPCTEKNSKEETKEVDNEDSLNLTIGEEDEKLLHEDSNTDADKKATETEKKASNEKQLDSKPSEEATKTDKNEGSSDKPVSANDEKESTGQTASTSAKSGSSDSKPKSSPTTSDKSPSTVSRNLWVSGLSTLTRATDLKLIFSKYGKVIGAKVVTNTRTPGTRCYGYVTMASAKDATECITHLHRTELHGRMISVERAKGDLGQAKPSGNAAKAEPAKSTSGESAKENKERDEKKEEGFRSRNYRSRSQYRGRSQGRSRSQHRSTRSQEREEKTRDEKSKDDTHKDQVNQDGTGPRRDDHHSRDRDRERDRRERDSDQKEQHRSRDREREVLSLQKIREERERQRLREKERQLREEDRRRREIRARQREEEALLRREREKLALERARIEKEKAELLRIERERQKLEREKIELERLELKRQQRKIEEAKRNLKRPATEHSHYDDDRKRAAGSDRRFEAPPPPSISAAGRGSYSSGDKKRLDDYSPSKRDEYPPKRDEYKSRDDYKPRPVDDYRRDSFKRNGGVMDDYKRDMDRPMQQMDSRYSDTRSGGGDYRGNSGPRDDRDRNGAVQKSRYMDSVDNRYTERSGGGGGGGGGGNGPWHNNAGPPQMSMGPSMGNDGWRMDNGQDRYDRTYNERKANQMNTGQFMDPSRQNQFMGGGSGGGRPQDRYGAPVSGRFDNGRY